MQNFGKFLGISPRSKLRRAAVGVEIEVEFKNELLIPALKNWTAKGDGSLRFFGVEFVSNPLAISQVNEALTEVVDYINKENHIKNSIRTSVHVHVNCVNLTHTEILTGLIFSWLIEESFLNECAPHRRSSRFCLRLQQAPVLLKMLYEKIAEKDKGFRVREDHLKYANIAYHTLQNKGTIEFRGMDGRYDVKHLDRWVKLCYNAIHNSSKMFKNPSDLVEAIINNPEIIYTILEDKEIKIDKESIEENHYLLYPLINTIDWEDYAKISISEEVEDIPPLLNVVDDIPDVRNHIARFVVRGNDF